MSIILFLWPNDYSNMTFFKCIEYTPVVKYNEIKLSAILLYTSSLCPIRITIIHEGLNLYRFYHELALYAHIFTLAMA